MLVNGEELRKALLTDEASISRIKPEMTQELCVSTEDAEKYKCDDQNDMKNCNTNRERSTPIIHTL